jgi:phenylacetate-coenzyme A ligase PaaK-like adenylate-forming protein
MNILDIFEEVTSKADLHLVSSQALADHKQQNFVKLLDQLNADQRKFWFGNVEVQSLLDLESVPAHTGIEVANTQQDSAAYGILSPGQLLFMSSGSTGKKRARWYFSWPMWMSHMIGISRSLRAYGIDNTDTLMTMDVANMQIGYNLFESAASMICKTVVVKSGGTTWTDKLNLITEHKVTVLAGTTTKLLRLCSILPKNYQHHLKLIVQLGEPLSAKQQDLIKNSFQVTHVLDAYGSVETGQISYNCPAGQIHMHDDLIHVVNRDNTSLFTNLSGMPVVNYIVGENIQYEYHGKCLCGSHLPVVTHFKNRNDAIVKKKE